MFRLPTWSPRFESRIDGVDERHDTHLDTVFIDADARRIEMLWRVALPLPRKSEKLECVTVYGEAPLSARIVADLAQRVRNSRNREGAAS